MHPIVLNLALLVTYTVAKTYTAYMLPKSVCFITQMQARRSTSGHIWAATLFDVWATTLLQLFNLYPVFLSLHVVLIGL